RAGALGSTGPGGGGAGRPGRSPGVPAASATKRRSAHGGGRAVFGRGSPWAIRGRAERVSLRMEEMVRIVGVRFKRAGKIYYFSPGELEVAVGDQVLVETAGGA